MTHHKGWPGCGVIWGNVWSAGVLGHASCHAGPKRAPGVYKKERQMAFLYIISTTTIVDSLLSTPVVTQLPSTFLDTYPVLQDALPPTHLCGQWQPW